MSPDKIEKFLHDGWVIVDIPQPDVIHEFAGLLQKKAQEICGSNCTLSNIHEMVDDEAFKNVHATLSQYFWDKEFSLRVSKSFLPILKEMIGLDIMVQYMPYFRLARPNKNQDNIGYHIDTQYGQTPYELAVHIPFVDLDENASLKVISGSHRIADSAFPSLKVETPNVIKGSLEHKLGRPYAPKRLGVPAGMKTEALTMRVGQAALFTPAIFHGQEMNTGNVTRVSTDVRFVNTYANANIRTGKTHAGYVPVSESPVVRLAQEYFDSRETLPEAVNT